MADMEMTAQLLAMKGVLFDLKPEQKAAIDSAVAKFREAVAEANAVDDGLGQLAAAFFAIQIGIEVDDA